MIAPPQFFHQIRERAGKDWELLESNPGLAGPWHQLFKQVQSPGHVLSELLQNADDAGATEAAVDIGDHCFVFTHNGEDFTERHFASLCRFGYSNKRALHTIGFRGIGFKSTFSLGDTVRLQSPTLSVAFEKRRFTEPKWMPAAPLRARDTEIRVAISDVHREKEVEKNLQGWLKAPLSLLFFRHIRRLRITDHEIHWGSMGAGPVAGTEWFALHSSPDDALLLARSPAEPFPPEALAEIRQERLLTDEQDADFPPCKVEIVLGAGGRLYVVLPTGIETALPFACNAPFIQDPARLKIKDPETSPTNRWLLNRVGTLAASVMLDWLGNESATLVERSRAYGLLPSVDRGDNSLAGTCSNFVSDAFDAALDGRPFLITNDAQLKPANQSIAIPNELFEVWRAEQITTLFDAANRPAMSWHVTTADLEKLVQRGSVDRLTIAHVIEVLKSKHLPNPASWGQLLKLWAFLSPLMTAYYCANKKQVCIVPVQGKDVLYSANEIVRLGEKRLLASDADWQFLSEHLLVLNQNWSRFLAEQRRAADENRNDKLGEITTAAFAVLKAIDLESSSDLDIVVEQVASAFFAPGSKMSIADCVRLAQIAAKLGAKSGEALQFVTRDRHLRGHMDVILFDGDGTLQDVLPEAWSSAHVMHPEYSKAFTSCSAEDWRTWISSGRAGLHEFVPLTSKTVNIYGRHRIEAELRRRGSQTAPSYQYKSSDFRIEDWDFEEAIWQHWIAISNGDEEFWGHLVEGILSRPPSFWEAATNARAFQLSIQGSMRATTNDPLLPAWVLKFQHLNCLSDTRGVFRKPDELLRRTPQTKSLMDVELFVHGRLDREATRPLLALLGVRETPTGPGRLLDCLRALAQSVKPPIHEVEKWYRRLDLMVDTCPSADLANIKRAFREEKIVLTEAGEWVTSLAVFLSADEEDVPGAAIVRVPVRDLALWRKLDVADRPTADLAIDWLKSLPSGRALSPDDARRVQGLLARHPLRIWHECEHWINLAREWAPVASLEYALTMQSLVEYRNLHEWVRQKTADLRLPAEVTEAPPFVNLPRLSSRIQEQFPEQPVSAGKSDLQAWLNRFGAGLSRADFEDETTTTRIRAFAADLAETQWRTATALEVIPYIDGTPAGTSRRTEVVWQNKNLFVAQLPRPKLARLVPEHLGKLLGRPDVTAALHYCFGRSVEDVSEYIEENFKLSARPPRSASDAADAGHDATPELDPASSSGASIEPVGSSGADAIAAAVSSGDVVPPSVSPPTEDQSAEPDEPGPTIRPVQKPAKLSIIERFARTHGFQKDGEDRYFHANGSWIAKANGDCFPWVLRTATGDLIRHYWTKDHCLEQEPLELEFEIWGLIDKFPESYALLLSDPQGNAQEIVGARLCAMRDNGHLTINPATYRLVVQQDRVKDSIK